jgi:hypothetical protein
MITKLVEQIILFIWIYTALIWQRDRLPYPLIIGSAMNAPPSPTSEPRAPERRPVPTRAAPREGVSTGIAPRFTAVSAAHTPFGRAGFDDATDLEGEVTVDLRDNPPDSLPVINGP